MHLDPCGPATKAARRRARWVATVCIIGGVGCATASREPAVDPDAGVNGLRTPADAAVGLTGDTGADSSTDLTGSFGHCCFEHKLLSCFCPTGGTCRFGVACDAGGCVEGDGGECDRIVTDGAVE